MAAKKRPFIKLLKIFKSSKCICRRILRKVSFWKGVEMLCVLLSTILLIGNLYGDNSHLKSQTFTDSNNKNI